MKKFIPVIALVLIIFPLMAGAVGVDPENAICVILNKVKMILAAIGLGLAVIFLIIGGIQYMTSQGDDEKAGKAKKIIINALIGIAIILAATFMLNVVEGFLSGAGMLWNPFTNPCTYVI